MKLEDEDTREVHYTDVGCALLDAGTCRCADYVNRQARVPDCVKLDPAAVSGLDWLPATCAYRIRAAGRDLPWWHPLVSGTAQTVVDAGISVRGRLSGSENDVAVEDLPYRIVTWPNRWPKRARREPSMP